MSKKTVRKPDQNAPKNSLKREDKTDEKLDNQKSNAPHYDTQQRTQNPNTDVEIAKGSLDDKYQTDSRPENP